MAGEAGGGGAAAGGGTARGVGDGPASAAATCWIGVAGGFDPDGEDSRAAVFLGSQAGVTREGVVLRDADDCVERSDAVLGTEGDGRDGGVAAAAAAEDVRPMGAAGSFGTGVAGDAVDLRKVEAVDLTEDAADGGRGGAET